MIKMESKDVKRPATKAAAAAPTTKKPVMIDMASIRTDGGTQSRAALNAEIAGDYAEAVSAGAKFPPITVFHDGSNYWLADGFHRHAAHATAGKKKILADVRQGTRRDAVLHSVGANEDHGLRRTREDKRRAVMTLLTDEEWGSKAERWIAATANVSHTFVQKVRDAHLATLPDRPDEREVTRGGTTYTMDTAAIGKSADVAAMIEPSAPEPAETQLTDPEPWEDADQEADGDGDEDSADNDLTSLPPASSDTSPAEPIAGAVVALPAAAPSSIDATARMLVHTEIRRFDTFCKSHPAESIAGGVSPEDVASVRMMANRLTKWLEAFGEAVKGQKRRAA